jgi:glycosyltransferase involved in cell wall biosynthesis|tara:strand:- start:170 stop:1348 length:1179 start_codon:yes stop_codon:yes gene_type:complete
MTDQHTSKADSLEITILMPCLNEAETIETCVRKAKAAIDDFGAPGEVLIADNGSTDGSQKMATDAGARVVDIENKGYGSALLGGIAAARSTYILMGDADDSYDFSHMPRYVEKLREGYDLVMGNRFKGGIAPGAMPFLHRYLGNPVLSWIGRLFFNCPSSDFHCGLRGFSKQAAATWDLQSTGMEFASEMVVKATLHNSRIAEVPTTLSPDGRTRAPHLRTWRDGWRHLRFMLLYSPRWLFLYPGMLLMIAGLATGAWLLPGDQRVGDANLGIHTMMFSAAAVLIGFQAVLFAFLSKTFAMVSGLRPREEKFLKIFDTFTLELGLVIGAVLVLIGIGGSIAAVMHWRSQSFGPLIPAQTLRTVIPAVTSLIMGCQTVLFSFFFSILGLDLKR